MSKEEIINSRVGGLGSSDAKLVAKVGATGELSDAMKFRMAQMLGLEETKQFSTPATRKGDRIELEVFEMLKLRYPTLKSNPKNKHDAWSEMLGFDVLNHIDYEFEDEENLIFIEHKSTKKSPLYTEIEYRCQLAWHYCILINKAAFLNKRPILLFSHYKTNDDEDEIFDISQYELFTADIPEVSCKNILAGLKIIAGALLDFNYGKKEELLSELLPSEMQKEIEEMHACLREIKLLQEREKQFKEKICEMMEDTNVKSIKNDFFEITRIAATKQVSLDGKSIKEAYPDIAAKYTKTTDKKSYVKLKLK